MKHTGRNIIVRDAVEADIPALAAIKGAGSEAIHADRLRDARQGGPHYLVLTEGQELVGFSCLVFRRPSHWSDAEDTGHLPQIVDLQIAENKRGQGYGSALIRAIEQRAGAAGARQIYLNVEPGENPRAYQLYLRLGFLPEQSEPYQKAWEFIDSEGKLHRGEEWVVDMGKEL